MRLYVPATTDQVRAWHASGTVSGHAEPYVAEDEAEESEYAALVAAAEDSAGLAPADGRRVVVVVEVAPSASEDTQLPWDRVVALHADLPGASYAEDLRWFATQEVDELLS